MHKILMDTLCSFIGSAIGVGIGIFLINKFTDWQFYQFCKRFKLMDLAHQKIQQELAKEMLSNKFDELMKSIKEHNLNEQQNQKMN